uniref:Reverse transcriptase domain-containing protein n=1 Tax=Tanacetum cinerariifolium TaxID=118510 RepID=A0A699HVS4_TANCI|nr:reverse transcriptase domain-containing protein [Tanacetum cinerariifolium]
MRKPKQEMTSITLAWPFYQYGIDNVGPLPLALGGARFLVVAIDYFTKWVDVKPPASMTGKHMEKFVWEHIVCKFVISHVVISDNWKLFAEGIFPVFCQKLDELQQVLWAHRTTPKYINRETPFSLVYGSEAVVSIEISVEIQRIKEFKARKNGKKSKEDLDILEEKREIVSIREAYYKQKLERYYNKCVRPSTFKQGTYVLRLNSAIKAEFQGKIGPTWEGPYVVKKAYGDEAYKLETLFGFPVDRT